MCPQPSVLLHTAPSPHGRRPADLSVMLQAHSCLSLLRHGVLCAPDLQPWPAGMAVAGLEILSKLRVPAGRFLSQLQICKDTEGAAAPCEAHTRQWAWSPGKATAWSPVVPAFRCQLHMAPGTGSPCFLLTFKTELSSLVLWLSTVSFSFAGTQNCEFPVTHHHSLSERRLLLCKPTFGK